MDRLGTGTTSGGDTLSPCSGRDAKGRAVTVLDMEAHRSLDSWRMRAACRDADTNLFFPAGETGEALEHVERAKAICRRCPVQEECLDYALAANEQSGIWGGATEAERRSIRRRRARQRRMAATA